MTKKEYYVKIWGDESAIEKSLEFDGVDDYVDLPNLGISGNQDVTLEAWITPETIGSGQTIFFFGNESTAQTFWFRVRSSGVLSLALVGATEFVNGNTILVAGNTYHVVGRYTASNKELALLVDGVVDNTLIAGTTANFNNANYAIGRRDVSVDTYFEGLISEVRLWNTARTQDQIRSNRNKKLKGSEAGLVAYYRLNGDATDSAGSNDGTLNNFVTDPWSTDTPTIKEKVYKGFFYDFNLSNFNLSMNSGPGALSMDVPRKFDDESLNDILEPGNQVKVVVYDKEAPQGVDLYNGFIAEDSRELSSTEKVRVEVWGEIVRLQKAPFVDSSGNHVKTYNQELADTFKDVIDEYQALVPGTDIGYTSSSIDNTGKSLTTTVNNEFFLDALNAAFELTDVDWYWYLDVDSNIYLKQFSTTADHYFMFERDIVSFKFGRSITDMVNQVNFWNGEPSGSGTYIAKKYVDSVSQGKYGIWGEFKNDSRYTVVASVDDFSDRLFENFADPLTPMEVVLADSNGGFGGYDIDSIKPGNTCKFQNYNPNSIIDGVKIITSVDHGFDSVKLVIEDMRAFIDRSVYELAKKQHQSDYSQDGPNTYS
jgi:hypothetical protein